MNVLKKNNSLTAKNVCISNLNFIWARTLTSVNGEKYVMIFIQSIS